jgi:protein phosphatase
MNLETAAVTDIGLRRANNEDAVLQLPDLGVFCVADGMGGQEEGEVASKAVVDTLEHAFSHVPKAQKNGMVLDKNLLSCQAIEEAGRWIYDRSNENGSPGTGTTAIALVFDQDPLEGATSWHAGDSRLYRYRNGDLVLCTRDHSVAALAGVSDENALPAMFRGMVTRAVGVQETVELEKTEIDVQKGDIFLLCSDGLTRMLSDSHIADILSTFKPSQASSLARDLVNEANRLGGEDNISVILVAV